MSEELMAAEAAEAAVEADAAPVAEAAEAVETAPKERKHFEDLFAGEVEDPDKESEYVGLTREEIAREEEFMRGIPRFNLAAFLLPPIWGPAHGIWITILFYPVWMFVDNCVYTAYQLGTVGPTIMAAIVVVSLAVITAMFALVAGPMSAHRAAEMGVPKEKYIRRQRIWAVVCALLGAVMLALATYYNLVLR